MGSERTDAINALINGQARRTSFYYVNTQVAERNGISRHKTVVGDNFIRIMPPMDPKGPWAMKVSIHQHIGPDDATFLCLKEMFGKPCAVCELIEAMKSSNADEKSIKVLFPRKRYLMFIYDVQSEATVAKGLLWYDAPGQLVDNIAGLSRDKRTRKIIDVCDPVEGRDIEFVRKGSGLNTEYGSFNLAQTDPVPPEWYKNVPNFVDVLLIPTYEQVLAELNGGIVQEQAPAQAPIQTPTQAPIQEQALPQTPAQAVTQQPVPMQSADGCPVGPPISSTPEPEPTINEQAPAQAPVQEQVPAQASRTFRGRPVTQDNPQSGGAPVSANVEEIRKKLEEIQRKRQQS